MPADRLVKLPEGISERTAATLMLKGLTVQYLFRQTYQLKAGDTILFHAAAGGVGLIACQWARALGVTMIGTVGSDEKAALAKANGCTHTIVYTRENFVERVKELTGGKGVPVVYDGDRQGHLSGIARLPVAARPVRELRQRVRAGAAVRHPAAVAEGLALRDAPDALHVHGEARRPHSRWPTRCSTLVQAGKIVNEPRQTYALKDAAKAHRDLESRETTGCDGAAALAIGAPLSSAAQRGPSSPAVRPSGPLPSRTQRVRRRAVQADGEAQRGLRVEALREKGAEHAGEHVAGAGARERRRCRWR